MALSNRQCYVVGGYLNGEEDGKRTHRIKFECRIETEGVEQLSVEQLFGNLVTATVHQSMICIKEGKQNEDK